MSIRRHPDPGPAPRFPLAALLAGCCLVAAGCGGRADVGRVSGVVTLDGVPLAGARVTFQPTTGGAPSHAVTDTAGRYLLRYGRSIAGARIGDHEVTISTLDKGNPDGDPPRPARGEVVPDRYNRRTMLAAAVRGGANTFDFSLTGQSAHTAGGAVRR